MSVSPAHGFAFGERAAGPVPEALVLRYAELVKRIAYHLVGRLPPSIEVDDLIQAGMMALLEAGRQYAPDRGASFETYAGIRVRGAMLDEVRRNNWAPRSVHRRMREVGDAIRRIEHEGGAPASPGDVAVALGIPLDEYHRILADTLSSRMFSFEQVLEEGQEGAYPMAEADAGPESELVDERFRAALAETIDGMPEREKLVLALYYDEELNLKEIGQVL
ncbi:MAG TPA: RNA polymerase sigma factor FliA, partial [Steroidobacteraceae bacterium]|nr:RNA polymerase sigma factor FliA [Steroidobacteraceae bacterium]